MNCGKLRRGIQEHVALFVGGSGTNAYDPVIRAIGAMRINDMQDFPRRTPNLAGTAEGIGGIGGILITSQPLPSLLFIRKV